MDTPPPRVTVAIVAYNSGPWLQRCVDALAGQTFADFEAVIADNASADDSVANLRLPDTRFRVVAMGANLGFAVANNRVAQASAAEFFACLNPDTEADPAWLGALVDAAGRHPHAAAFGSTQLAFEDPTILDGVGDVWHASGIPWRARHGRPSTLIPPEGEVFAPCAAASLYRSADFLDVGGFDERFFCYCEDNDLGFRLRLVSRASIQVPSAVVKHAGSAISGKRSDFTVYHGHRNRIWSFLKNTPGPLMWLALPYALFVNLWLITVFIRIGQPRALLRAYRDALKGLGPTLRARRAIQAGRTASAKDISEQMEWSLWAIRSRDVRGGRGLGRAPVIVED